MQNQGLHELPYKIILKNRVIYLVSSQNFLKNYYFLPPDTHTLVSLSGGKKC